MKNDRQPGLRYTAVSVLSGTIDTALFAALVLLLKKRRPASFLAIAVLCPRLITAAVNYCLHQKFTFRLTGKRSLRRYTLLAAGTLAISYCNAHICYMLIGDYVLILKPAGDAVLSLMVSAFNRRWVFAKTEPGRFYGSYARTVKKLSKYILKRYDISGIEERHAGQPVVYVCRHGNMHGPVNTLSNFRNDIHPMVLDCFFTVKDCRRHYYEFTFSSRFGMPKVLARLLAGLSAVVTVPIMHSLQAIPVHRNSNAMSTLRTAVKCLEKGESVIVFPDVSYTDSSGDGEIYRGFVTIGHIYLRSTGKPLHFVPLVIDDANARITALDSYKWHKNSDRSEAAEYLRHAIHTDPANIPPASFPGSSADITPEFGRYA